MGAADSQNKRNANKAVASPKLGQAETSSLKRVTSEKRQRYTPVVEKVLKIAKWRSFEIPKKICDSILNNHRVFHPLNSRESEMLVLGPNQKPDQPGAISLFVATLNLETMALKQLNQASNGIDFSQSSVLFD